MALASLATVPELETRLGAVVSDPARAEALLDDASAQVRRITGQQFTLVEDDEVILPVDRGRIRLPQRPAQAPTAIAAVYPSSFVLVVGGWSFDGVDTVLLGAPTYVANGPTESRFVGSARVTYTHGYPEIPSDVVGIVCQMVIRVLASQATPGLRGEAIDDYRYDLGGGLTAGTIGVVPEERRQLERFRRRTASVALR